MRTLDSTDLRLLLALTASPRATTVALAEQLKLSRNTVQARLASLEASGAFLSFERCIDQAALGYPLTAFTTIHAHQQQLATITHALLEIPQVVQAHGLSGPSDIMAKIVCRSAEELFEVNAQLLAIPGVERTETALAISELVPYRIAPLIREAAREL
ncbi:Lrp/AsnC family transcriptional regulator [Salinibacterium sp. G-O1]|uniref:Lrp/AsnC family transcriptional regulator n=1 Tax=Salinibacterium sp. G-O1 TaxID=3046208 RepID=UPI0024BB1CD4|nr:Lrp/AsnC family transcriptional regulator [Salinibacterium sp. G-O1]MDJ0333867.1 Lrp/AsnC family transcriptional regulator [Salinibacterium sp. G-O1]